MRILYIDEKERTVKLRIETEDDLWDLYNVIEMGDIVYARTTRELKTSSGSKRKAMSIGLRVVWTRFQPFTTRLRVHGVIVQAPKELDLEGQRHTLNLDLGHEVTIHKEKGWDRYQMDRIRKACRRSMVKALIVGVDDEEVTIATVHDYGIEPLVEMILHIPGKIYPTAKAIELKRELNRISSKIKELCKRLKIEVLILAGPGIMKELVEEELQKYPELRQIKVYLENVSSGGYKGVHEALKRGVLLRVLRDYSITEESKLIEEVLTYLAKDERKVALSLDEVEKAVRIGAVDKLFITSELMRSPDETLRRRVEEILKIAENTGARVKIFSSFQDAYLQLKHMGGIVAILRYQLS